jgi:hypothetical protein
MFHVLRTRIGIVLLAATSVAASTGEQEADLLGHGPKCKQIRAEMIEQRSTVGCKPQDSFCFLGEVDGSHGFHATTYFKGDSSGVAPPASPDFLPYSGLFEYRTSRGTIFARETGIVNQSQGNPESGAITTYQKILSADGDLIGATGHFFVNGFNRNPRIETSVIGEICLP